MTEFVVDEKDIGFFATNKFANGQTCQIQFHESCCREFTYYFVEFDVFTKRKSRHMNFVNVIGTGKTGLESLLWAKNVIKDFVEFISKVDNYAKYRNSSYKRRIIVCWSDNRRRRIYERGLKDLGFYFTMMDGKKVLMKEIILTEE